MKVWLSSVESRKQVDVRPDDTVAALFERGGVTSTTSVGILAGRMLDPATRVAELGLNATSHIVVLSTSIAPSQQQQQQQGARPLFDPAAVSGLLAQLNLQFQQQQPAPPPRFSGREEALIRDLMEMGFSRNRSEHAVLSAGQGATLEGCSQWIVETIDDAALELPPVVRVLQPPPAAAAAPVAPPVAPVARALSPAERCVARGVCTLAASGTRFVAQRYFQCFSCPGLHEGGGVCGACAEKCHKGHQLDQGHFSEAFFCDCGLTASCRCRDVTFDPDSI